LGDNAVFLGMEDYNLGAYEMVKDSCSNIVVVEPLTIRRDWLKRIGAEHVVDPAATNAVEYIRSIMPFGADIVYVAAEAIIPETRKFLSTAYEAVRPLGTVVMLRPYGDDLWHNSCVNVAWTKEVKLQFAICWGDEPYRGGRQRGDMQVAMEWVADGRIRADSHFTKIVDLADIDTKADVDALFHLLPHKAVKIGVRVSSKEQPKNALVS